MPIAQFERGAAFSSCRTRKKRKPSRPTTAHTHTDHIKAAIVKSIKSTAFFRPSIELQLKSNFPPPPVSEEKHIERGRGERERRNELMLTRRMLSMERARLSFWRNSIPTQQPAQQIWERENMRVRSWSRFRGTKQERGRRKRADLAASSST